MSDRNGRPRVLVIHNRYRSPGGEERAAADLTELLRDRGHTVRLLERDSAELTGLRGRALAGAGMLNGGLQPRRVAAAVREIGADIIHAHNIFPLFGPRALDAARNEGAHVVLHLHNYRQVCAIGIAYRDGAVCTRCQGSRTTPGIRLRCRGNLPEALAYGAGIHLRQPRTLKAAHRFLLTSEGSRETLAQLGLALSDYDVIPNFLPDSAFASRSRADRGQYALFAGRLSEEKGADTAIEACSRAGVPLAIAGQGPDEPRLRRLAAASESPVEFLGHVDPAGMPAIRQGAGLALVPSRWHEPHPYAVSEAMAAGVPVLVSDMGGLPEMAGTEASLAAADSGAWAHTVGELWGDQRLRQRRGEEALERARERFSADAYYEALMACYRAARA